jgi:hypothetical protein
MFVNNSKRVKVIKHTLILALLSLSIIFMGCFGEGYGDWGYSGGFSGGNTGYNPNISNTNTTDDNDTGTANSGTSYRSDEDDTDTNSYTKPARHRKNND